MAVDLAVCFSERRIEARHLVATSVVQALRTGNVYAVTGTLGGGLSYFSLWSTTELDLVALCAELSRLGSPICVAWKSEHGSVGGFIEVANGQVVRDQVSNSADYLSLPSIGVESAMGPLSLSSADRLRFPEIVLSTSSNCFRLNPAAGIVEHLGPETLRLLLEDDLNVEPVLPTDSANLG